MLYERREAYGGVGFGGEYDAGRDGEGVPVAMDRIQRLEFGRGTVLW